MKREAEQRGGRLSALGSDQGGAVLLELVIAIPLFVVLLGGMMWLGDLALAKHKLVSADRVAAWNRGNRHGQPALGEIRTRLQNWFFPAAQVGRQPVSAIREMAADNRLWSEGRGATAVLRPEMPEWARGWLRAGVSWELGEAPRQPATTVHLLGRDVDGDGHHRVLTRSRAGVPAAFPRNWTARALADEGRSWSPNVHEEPWPENLDTIAASGWSHPGAPQGYRHQPRYRQYRTWSQ